MDADDNVFASGFGRTAATVIPELVDDPLGAPAEKSPRAIKSRRARKLAESTATAAPAPAPATIPKLALTAARPVLTPADYTSIIIDLQGHLDERSRLDDQIAHVKGGDQERIALLTQMQKITQEGDECICALLTTICNALAT